MLPVDFSQSGYVTWQRVPFVLIEIQKKQDGWLKGVFCISKPKNVFDSYFNCVVQSITMYEANILCIGEVRNSHSIWCCLLRRTTFIPTIWNIYIYISFPR